MAKFEVVDLKPYHLGQIARRLRRGHVEALARVGIDRREIHRQLADLFGKSAFRRAWLIDGKLAAVGGVTGMVLSETGFVWLAVTQDAVAFGREMVREAKRQLGEIMGTRKELATTLIADDPAAMRFAQFLGFRGDGTAMVKVGAGHAMNAEYRAEAA